MKTKIATIILAFSLIGISEFSMAQPGSCYVYTQPKGTSDNNPFSGKRLHYCYPAPDRYSCEESVKRFYEQNKDKFRITYEWEPGTFC